MVKRKEKKQGKRAMLDEVLENFLEMMIAERSVSDNTIAAYKNDLKDLVEHLKFHEIEIQNVTLEALEQYLSKLKNHELSGKTISRKISSMRQLFQFCHSERLINRNVAIELVAPRKSQSIPKPLEESEITALLKAISHMEKFEGIRTSAMLEMLYATGMRISELITLKMQSLEREHHLGGAMSYILVKGKGGRERIVLLNNDSTAALKEYLAIRFKFIKKSQKTDWLFPSSTKDGQVSHITRQRFGQILKKLAILGNLDHKKVSPHKIRHSFATHMLKNGANLRVVQELLGHSDISSTQIYTKITDDQAAKLVLEKHPLKNS